MKKFVLTLLVAAAGILFTQKSQAQTVATQQVKYVQITTIESVVNGGLGRSKMILTKEDGSQEERDLNNLFSMVGLNFKNIRENESSIIQTLKSYTDTGWKLVSTTPFTLSLGNNGSEIFMSRYLLCK